MVLSVHFLLFNTRESQMANCLIINGTGAVAIALARDLCQSGYFVYLSASQSELGVLQEFDVTNPELRGKYQIIVFSPKTPQLKAIESSIAFGVDCVVSLNKTTGETGLVYDDLDIIKSLGNSGIITSETNVLVGLQDENRIPDDMVFALEDEVTEMAPSLVCHSISTDFNDLFKSDDDFLSTKVVSNLRKSSLKRKSIISFYELLKWLLYYLLPEFIFSFLF